MKKAQVIDFKSFLAEEEKSYKLVVITSAGGSIRDTKDETTTENVDLISKYCKQLGITFFRADFTGGYTKKRNSKRLLYSFGFDKDGELISPDSRERRLEYQEPFLCSPDDTIIMPRGLGTIGFTASRAWYDMVKEFEYDGYFIINSLEGYDICTSKQLTYTLFTNNDIRTPRTARIVHSEGAEQAFKELNTKFPIILKSSTGTQTGVGVVVIESMRSLQAIVQMILLYNKYLPIIIQEYIETDYDMRVVVCNGEVMGAMKRNVIKGDVRSNASLGAKTEEIELTDLEKTEAIKIAKASKCSLAGVDLIPSKDRENEKPYCLEVNANLGYAGIEKVIKGKSVTKEILKHFMNRENWRI